jgi:hypothetical protein
MYRLSRGKKREQKRAVGSAASVATSIAVHVGVPMDGAGTGPAGAWASVGGVRVRPAPGQEIQQAVLNHLHRIALAAGHPVLATVTDERIGYVVPLQVRGDGSSTFTAEPVRTAPPVLPIPHARPAAPRPPGDAAAGYPPPDTATHVLRQLPGPADCPAPAVPPGTAVAPLGEFGPPPVMDAGPADADVKPTSMTGVDADTDAAVVDPDPKPTPVRGFDAVAEAVLGNDPRAVGDDGGPVLLAEPVAQVSEAVKDGRIEEAAALAERTVAEASGTLGADHPEVLRVRELSAYIAYLAGEPRRAFGLSLDLARIHRRARDAEGAYGNVQSAATAWRAVRDPEEGLRLGHDLLGLWSELTAEDGPAAEDIEELDSARARMDRLAERARRQAPRTD